MLTTIICPRCVRLMNRFSISILQTRYLSTPSNDPLPSSVDQHELENITEIDRNVSRLPADVYQHFKGRIIYIYFLYCYISIG